MHISLTEDLDNYVRMKVGSGLYGNSSEVIREALRKMIMAESNSVLYDDWVRAELAIAEKSFAEGKDKPYDMKKVMKKAQTNRRMKNG